MIFIDLPKKINNSDFELYKNIPIEVSLREKIGEVVAPDNLETLVDRIEHVFSEKRVLKIIAQERDKIIYNVGKSSRKGADYIQNLLNNFNY